MSTEKSELPVENPDNDQQRSEEPPTTIADLATELLTKLLEFVALDGNRKNMLGCREVNSQWKDVMDLIIENGISSCKFEAFSQMRTENINGQLKVRCSSSRFAEGRNSFPFNSLHLTTGPASSIVPECSQFKLLSLLDFASRFGGNLTTLSLQNITTISLTTLAEMLSFMPNLKRLSLTNVTDMDSGGQEELVIPTAPPLPNLTVLKLVLRMWLSKDDKAYAVLVWLIGSYAEQLVDLELNSIYTLPALQPRHQYIYSDSSGETLTIVTTSESAFCNLKKLRIFHPNQEFLITSETPALQYLLLVNSSEGVLLNKFTLGDVVDFIGKCSSTLETLYLNFMWNESRNDEAVRNFLEEYRATEVACPRLKTAFLHYPFTTLQDMILNAFLRKFPALTTLHLLRFRVHHFDEGVPVGQLQNVNELENEDNQNNEAIVALRDRLAPLYQRMSGIQNEMALALSAKMNLLEDLPDNEVQIREVVVQVRQLDAEMRTLNDAMNVARNVRAEIYTRLVALGELTKDVMVQQLLERGEFWNTLPNLRTVSVSTGHTPDGDVCVVQRTEDA